MEILKMAKYLENIYILPYSIENKGEDFELFSSPYLFENAQQKYFLSAYLIGDKKLSWHTELLLRYKLGSAKKNQNKEKWLTTLKNLQKNTNHAIKHLLVINEKQSKQQDTLEITFSSFSDSDPDENITSFFTLVDDGKSEKKIIQSNECLLNINNNKKTIIIYPTTKSSEEKLCEFGELLNGFPNYVQENILEKFFMINEYGKRLDKLENISKKKNEGLFYWVSLLFIILLVSLGIYIFLHDHPVKHGDQPPPAPQEQKKSPQTNSNNTNNSSPENTVTDNNTQEKEAEKKIEAAKTKIQEYKESIITKPDSNNQSLTIIYNRAHTKCNSNDDDNEKETKKKIAVSNTVQLILEKTHQIIKETPSTEDQKASIKNNLNASAELQDQQPFSLTLQQFNSTEAFLSNEKVKEYYNNLNKMKQIQFYMDLIYCHIAKSETYKNKIEKEKQGKYKSINKNKIGCSQEQPIYYEFDKYDIEPLKLKKQQKNTAQAPSKPLSPVTN